MGTPASLAELGWGTVHTANFRDKHLVGTGSHKTFRIGMGALPTLEISVRSIWWDRVTQGWLLAELVAKPSCSSGILVVWSVWDAACSFGKGWELTAARGEELRVQAVQDWHSLLLVPTPEQPELRFPQAGMGEGVFHVPQNPSGSRCVPG